MKRRILPLFLLLCLLLSMPAYASQVPAAVSGSCTQAEWDILTLTNQQRLKQGLSPLSIFPKLQAAADARERDLAVYYSHTRPDGSDCFTVLDQAGLGYNIAGENIATGFTSAAGVMDGWMSSPGHRENILTGSFRHLGAGHTTRSGKYGSSSVQLFLASGRCTLSDLRLSQSSLSLPRGGSVDAQNLYLIAGCAAHGSCYLPLLPGMYSGFQANTPGLQSVRVSYLNQTVTLPVQVSAFADVSNEYFGDAVAWAVERGITSGTGNYRFTPQRSCTRGEVVTFLWRAAGSPAPGSQENPFSDVKSGDFYENAVLWAYENGITAGVDAARFAPNSPCTRGQVVTFLYRAAGSPFLYGIDAPFVDVPAASPFADAVGWAVESGITTGADATHFSPDASCTRGQVVTFLYRSAA